MATIQSLYVCKLSHSLVSKEFQIYNTIRYSKNVGINPILLTMSSSLTTQITIQMYRHFKQHRAELNIYSHTNTTVVISTGFQASEL